MKYFFILGTNPEVSRAEILALLSTDVIVTDHSQQVLLVESDSEIDTVELMTKLGGTIKVGQLSDNPLPLNEGVLAKYMADTLIQEAGEGKIKFGYSIYALTDVNPSDVTEKASKRLYKAGMETKRMLKEADFSVRWVRAQSGPALTSVVVEKDNLIKAGLECVVLVKDGQMHLGRTTAVQPFELFSKIDFGRPERDTYRGMLPPKLARIMINITGVRADSVIWDAFCGSGTVVTEALRLGMTNILGSDLSPEAVEATKKNIAWLEEKNMTPADYKADIFQHDAKIDAVNIAGGSVDAIVSEPFLGKPQHGNEPKAELTQQLDELTELYRVALATLKKKLSPQGSIVLALPLYIVDGQRLGVDLDQIMGDDFTKDDLLPEKNSEPPVYGRVDQKVWRQIVRLRSM